MVNLKSIKHKLDLISWSVTYCFKIFKDLVKQYFFIWKPNFGRTVLRIPIFHPPLKCICIMRHISTSFKLLWTIVLLEIVSHFVISYTSACILPQLTVLKLIGCLIFKFYWSLAIKLAMDLATN